jgi:hypothetical protein
MDPPPTEGGVQPHADEQRQSPKEHTPGFTVSAPKGYGYELATDAPLGVGDDRPLLKRWLETDARLAGLQPSTSVPMDS